MVTANKIRQKINEMVGDMGTDTATALRRLRAVADHANHLLAILGDDEEEGEWDVRGGWDVWDVWDDEDPFDIN